MKKILYLPTRYFPSISGAEFYLQRMAELLSSRQKIDIFTSNAIDFKALRDPKGRIIKKKEKYFKKVNNLEINRFPINYEISLEDRITYIKNIKEYNSLNLSDDCLKELLENGPFMKELIDYFLNTSDLNYSLIHSTFFPYFNLLINLIVGKLIDKPVVCTPFFHFSNPRYLNNKLLDVLKKFDLLVACTEKEKRILVEKLKIHEDKIKVIPMGVDYDKFERVHKTKDNFYFKKKFFRKNETRFQMILFCGYKNYEKGAISILKAVPYILEKIKKIYFVFIGPPTLAFNKEQSKIKKKNKVRIINFTPDNLTGYYDKKKISAFNEADVYLMPSRTDAFGIAFLEAWASGIPVIGANIGATPEVINDTIDGYLVEFDNPEDIAKKVVKLLRSKNLRKSLGSAGKMKVIKYHSWNTIAEKTQEAYQNLINKNKQLI